MEGILRKASRSEGTVHLKKKGSRNCVRITSKESAQIHHVILGHRPCVPELQITNKLEIWREVFVPTQRSRSPDEKKTKEGVKGSLTFIEKVKELGGETQDAVSPTINSISRKGRKSSRPNLRLRYTEDALRSMKLRDRQGPSLVVVIQPAHSHERSFSLHKFQDRTQEDTLAKERWARIAAWDLVEDV